MFVEAPNKEELRQGDIIEGLLFPIMQFRQLSLLGTPHESSFSNTSPNLLATFEEKKKVFTAQVKVFQAFAIVLSQCCDIAIRADGKLDAPVFVVAPLIDVPYQVQKNSEMLSLLQNNSTENFVNFFYITQQDPLPKSFIVDFGRPLSVPREELSFVLSRKVLEMTSESRLKFKNNLSFHFGRLTLEEQEAQEAQKAPRVREAQEAQNQPDKAVVAEPQPESETTILPIEPETTLPPDK